MLRPAMSTPSYKSAVDQKANYSKAVTDVVQREANTSRGLNTSPHDVATSRYPPAQETFVESVEA